MQNKKEFAEKNENNKESRSESYFRGAKKKNAYAKYSIEDELQKKETTWNVKEPCRLLNEFRLDDHSLRSVKYP